MTLLGFEAIITALSRQNVRYLIVGGLATAAHGYVRMTADLDLVIDLAPPNIQAAFLALDELGYQPRVPITADQFANPAMRASWIQEKRMLVLNLFSETHPLMPVDIFVDTPFAFEEAYEDALCQVLESGYECRFVALPRLIEMKTAAGRAKDLDDLAHLSQLLEERE